MKFLCLTSFLLMVNLSVSGSGNDTIFWSTEQLGFKDFSMEVVNETFAKTITGNTTNTELEGYIFSGITFSLLQEGSTITCQVKAYMIPQESWLSNKNDTATLAHEQAHFDITEIFARKLRRDLSKIKSAGAAKRQMELNFVALQEEQRKFDKSHKSESGVNTTWKNKIESGLKELAEWSNPIVISGKQSTR
jgi:hypothetical protein